MLNILAMVFLRNFEMSCFFNTDLIRISLMIGERIDMENYQLYV